MICVQKPWYPEEKVCDCVCFTGHVEEGRAGGPVGVGDGLSVPHRPGATDPCAELPQPIAASAGVE